MQPAKYTTSVVFPLRPRRSESPVVDCAFAGRRIVIFSGGAAVFDDDKFLDEIRAIHAGGGFGSIIGRNSFQRPKEVTLRMLGAVMDIYASPASFGRNTVSARRAMVNVGGAKADFRCNVDLVRGFRTSRRRNSCGRSGGSRLDPCRRHGRALRAEYYDRSGVVDAARRSTQKPLNVHLMIVEPERYLTDFAKAGADHLLVPAEPSATTIFIVSSRRSTTSARGRGWCSIRRARLS